MTWTSWAEPTEPAVPRVIPSPPPVSAAPGRSERLALPWDAPPLRSNDRYHWAEKARRTKAIRSAAHWVAKSAGVSPFPGRVTVTGVWTVTDRRVRDEGSMAPSVKAAIDGLVDAGVLPNGDGSRWVHEQFRIEMDSWPSFALEIVGEA